MRNFVGVTTLGAMIVAGAALSSFETACSSSSSPAPATSSSSAGPKFTVDNYPKPAIANAVDKGDPLWEGQFYLLYDTWGGELNGGWPADFLLEVLKEEPDVFGNQFEKFGFIPDANDDLPIGLKRGTKDPTTVVATCAPCHTGRLPDGTVWFGQPNLQIDSPGLDYALNQRWMAKGHPSMLTDTSAARAQSYGPGRFRIDSDGYTHAVAANIPVHYDLDLRSHLSTVGGAHNARTDIFLSVGAQVNFPLDDNTKTPFPSDDDMMALVGFMTSHHSPVAPPQDATLVAQGKTVFHTAQCDSCHHPDDVSQDGVTTLDSAADGKDRLPGADPNFPRGSVHVDPYQYFMAFGDPSQAGDAGGGLDPQTITIIKFGYIHQLDVGTTDGYVAPNLHGLWASAPYLNNGSVPTLQDLLNPASQRPTQFTVQGWTFDTTQVGNSNMGHEFGTDLSPSDKTALIAYLNSL